MKIPPSPEKVVPAATAVRSEKDRSFLIFAGVVLAAIALGFKSELLDEGQVWALSLGLVVVAAPALLGYLRGTDEFPRIEHYIPVALGAITVKTGLTPTMVVLHLATAMLLLGVLLVAARGSRLTPGTPGLRPGSAVALALGFVTVLLGALTANLGAAAACTGFPLCSGELWPSAGGLAVIQWVHRLLAYTLSGYVVWWAVRSRGRRAWTVVALVAIQVAVGAATVLLGLPPALQAAHVAVGAAVWAGVVLTAR